MTPRSWLYVPGDAGSRLARAPDRGADALIVDLEDGVAETAKNRARDEAAHWLAGQRRRGPQLWVRVNPGERRPADVRAVVTPALSGVCAAKTQNAEELVELDRMLSSAEAAAGLPIRSVRVIPLLETAAAVLAALTIATGPRVTRLQLGEADLRADTGIEPGDDERELLWARSQVVFASAAAGVEPPVGPVSIQVRDPDGLRASTLALRRLGFFGRACIHPVQIQIVHEVFTPSPDRVDAARRLLDAYQASLTAGAGVLLDDDGRLVDEAVVRSARRLLADAPAAHADDERPGQPGQAVSAPS